MQEILETVLSWINNEKIEEGLQKLYAELKREIDELRAIRDSSARASAVSNTSVVERAAPAPEVRREVREEQRKSDDAQIKPRSGDYVSNDVLIEDVFYCGKK